MVERTVLCVDDEENVLRSLKRLLRREPFKLLTANGAAEGLAAMGREPVHLVISDHRMPEMTGTEFLAEVQRRWPETVRVVLSGFADAASVVEAINEGRVFRFLAKPWNDDELKANIRACLDQYELIHSHRVLTDQLSLKNVELRALTDRLSATVEERTRVLRIVQNILRWIPVPAVGICTEGVIAMTNVAGERLFGVNSPVCVGQPATAVLPRSIVDCLSDSLAPQDPSGFRVLAAIGSQECHVQVIPLTDGREVLGNLVIAEELACETTA